MCAFAANSESQNDESIDRHEWRNHRDMAGTICRRDHHCRLLDRGRQHLFIADSNGLVHPLGTVKLRRIVRDDPFDVGLP
jgi:hypothetical protein